MKVPDINSFNDDWNADAIFSIIEYRIPKELKKRLNSGPLVPLEYSDAPSALRLDDYWLKEPVIKFLDEVKLKEKN